MKLGGGSPPIRTAQGWLMIYHGSKRANPSAFTAAFGRCSISTTRSCIRLEDETPLLEASPELTRSIAAQMYLSEPRRFHDWNRRRG